MKLVKFCIYYQVCFLTQGFDFPVLSLNFVVFICHIHIFIAGLVVKILGKEHMEKSRY